MRSVAGDFGSFVERSPRMRTAVQARNCIKVPFGRNLPVWNAEEARADAMTVDAGLNSGTEL